MGGGGVGRELQACLSSLFFLLLEKKQHRNIFSNHTGRLARFGWILTYLKISVEMAVTWFLPEPFNYFWMMPNKSSGDFVVRADRRCDCNSLCPQTKAFGEMYQYNY